MKNVIKSSSHPPQNETVLTKCLLIRNFCLKNVNGAPGFISFGYAGIEFTLTRNVSHCFQRLITVEIINLLINCAHSRHFCARRDTRRMANFRGICWILQFYWIPYVVGDFFSSGSISRTRVTLFSGYTDYIFN